MMMMMIPQEGCLDSSRELRCVQRTPPPTVQRSWPFLRPLRIRPGDLIVKVNGIEDQLGGYQRKHHTEETLRDRGDAERPREHREMQNAGSRAFWGRAKPKPIGFCARQSPALYPSESPDSHLGNLFPTEGPDISPAAVSWFQDRLKW